MQETTEQGYTLLRPDRDSWAENILPVFLSFQNPLITENITYTEALAEAVEGGYDSLIVKGQRDTSGRGRVETPYYSYDLQDGEGPIKMQFFDPNGAGMDEWETWKEGGEGTTDWRSEGVATVESVQEVFDNIVAWYDGEVTEINKGEMGPESGTLPDDREFFDLEHQEWKDVAEAFRKDPENGIQWNEGDTRSDIYVAFKPEQIKSAIANIGTYDPSDSRIRYAISGEENIDFPETLYAMSPAQKKAKVKEKRAEVNRLKNIVKSVIFTRRDAPRDRDVGIIIEPKAGNNQPNIDKIDVLLERHQKPLESAEAWKAFTHDMAGLVIEPPHKMLEYINNPDKFWEDRNNFNQRGLDRAEHGLAHIADVRKSWTDGSISRETSDKLIPMIVLWNQLSAQISPFQHEGGFLDLVHHGVADWIDASRTGVFNEEEYTKWYKDVVVQEQGNGPGTTYTKNSSISRNFPNFLKFLQMDAQEGPHAGKGMFEVFYDMMTDPEMTGQRFRREFMAARGTQKSAPGIDTKLLTFMLLGQGFNDLIVWDRVNVNGFWDTQLRAKDYQLPMLEGKTEGEMVQSTNL